MPEKDRRVKSLPASPANGTVPLPGILSTEQQQPRSAKTDKGDLVHTHSRKLRFTTLDDASGPGRKSGDKSGRSLDVDGTETPNISET